MARARGAKSFAMKTIGEQAREFREWKGWNSREMAEAVGTSRQNIEKLELIGARQPKYLGDLAKAMGTSVEDLLNGRYSPPVVIGEVDPVYKTNASRPVRPKTYRIPQYNTGGSMGRGVVLRDQPGVIRSIEVSQEWANKNLPAYTSIEALAIVTGFGDSMRGMFEPGDPLMVDTGITKCDHDGVVFFRVGDEGYIKRLQRIPGADGSLILRAKSANPEYDPFDITEAMDFEVFAKVLRAWKGTNY